MRNALLSPSGSDKSVSKYSGCGELRTRKMSIMDSDSPKGTQNERRGGKGANKRKSKWKKAEIVAVFAVIEVISLVLWQKADDFSGIPGKYIHWISECGFLVGGAYLAHEFTKKRILIWIGFAVLCLALLLTKSVEPIPHFKLSLRIGDSPDSKVYLTNDFLFKRQMVKVGDLPNGAKIVKSFVNGCLVIPVQDGESNKVFNITAENDSPVTVKDLVAFVGFPKEWQCGFDPKWHKIDEWWMIPGWKMIITNMQFVAAQSPWVLYPNDDLTFPPITNVCTPEYIGSTSKGGLIDVGIRSMGDEVSLAANIIFISVGTNIFKPFVTVGYRETDGTLSITPKQFEDSQR